MSERAGIGLCGETIEHLNHWMKVRRILLPDSTLVFLSWKGEIIQNLTTKVRTLAQSFGLDLPTTREVRSNVGIRATSIDSTKQTLVARHLSHSKRSAEKSYIALEASKRDKAFQVVENVMGMDDNSSPRTQPLKDVCRWKFFTAEEEELISSHFEKNISSKVPP